MKLLAYAKINTSLQISGIAPNGYHLLDMVMNSVNLYDEITINVAKNEHTVTMLTEVGEEFFVPKEKNTIWKALKLFFEMFSAKTTDKYVDITVVKHIPEGAGLGGSSADPAAVLVGLGAMFGVALDEYRHIAPLVGSDVSFMLLGGRMRVLGTGECLVELPYVKLVGVLVKPQKGVNTALCYSLYDEMKKDERNCSIISAQSDEVIPDYEKMQGKIINKSKAIELGLDEKFCNVLSCPAMVLNNDIVAIYKLLCRENVIAVMMTGSGSAVFAITESIDDAKRIIEKIPKEYFSSVFETAESGVKIVD